MLQNNANPNMYCYLGSHWLEEQQHQAHRADD